MTTPHQTIPEKELSSTLTGTLRVVLLGAILCGFAGLLHGETTGPEKGVLLVHGGGGVNFKEFVDLAKKASGNDQPVIRIITTPQGERRKADFKKGVPFSCGERSQEAIQAEGCLRTLYLVQKGSKHPRILRTDR